MPDIKLTLSAKDLSEYHELECERKDLERRARAIGKRTSALASHFLEFLEQSGKERATREGIVLELTERAGRPSWKDEFVARLGAKAAEEVATSVPSVKGITVSVPR